MYLLEDKDEVALYRNDSNRIIANYRDKALTLIGIDWNLDNPNRSGWGYIPISAEIYNDKISANDGNILLLWQGPLYDEAGYPSEERWQALSFSSTSGVLLGAYGHSGHFYSIAEMNAIPYGTSERTNMINDVYFGPKSNDNGNDISTEESRLTEINQLGVLFPDIYYGVAKESSRTYEQNQTYELGGIKDFDGNPHANTGAISAEAKQAYKYQGILDVNNDGVKEAIFTNKETGRWVTACTEDGTGEIDYTDHGSDGITRVVGIYIDPLVTSGEVEQFGPHDSQRRFQNDLKIDNLIAKTSGDYDGDGFQEVYWKTNDGTAYLRALMHADGNIQYANYQSEEQMSDYLTSKGFASVSSDII